MKVLISILCLLLALGVCIGQIQNNSRTKTRPNLSGVWALDNSKSDLMQNVVDYVLTIVHQEPEVRMTKKYRQGGREVSQETVYYTDGRPEFNSLKGRDPEPITRWQGNKLVRRSSVTPTGIATPTSPPIEFATKEEWELSPDNNTLTRTIMSSGVVTKKSKYVFRRIS